MMDLQKSKNKDNRSQLMDMDGIVIQLSTMLEYPTANTVFHN